MELKVFTLPSCPSCSIAKNIAFEVAQEVGVAYREVDMATKEGKDESLTHSILGAPSIVMGDQVITRGKLISKEKLLEETKKQLECWKARASSK